MPGNITSNLQGAECPRADRQQAMASVTRAALPAAVLRATVIRGALIRPVVIRAAMIGAAVFGVAAIGGCAQHDEPPGAAAARWAAPSVEPRAAPTLAIAGRLMNGADQTAIRAYLRSVREIKPRKLSVQWSADTVAVSREEAMRSLKSVSGDGSLYTFESSEPVVARLQPGRILWIWDITIRRIDRVEQIDGETVVHARPVPLAAALTRADIEFEAPIELTNAYASLRPHLPKAAPAKTSALVGRSPYRRVALNLDGPEPPSAPAQPAVPPDGNDGAPAEDDTDYGLIAATREGYTGRLQGFEYSLEYQAFPTHSTLELEARKEEEGNGRGESHEVARDQRDEFFEHVKEQKEDEHRASEEYDEIAALTRELQAAQQERNSAMGESHNATELGQAIEHYKQQRQQAIEQYEKWKAKALEEQAAITAMVKAGRLAKQLFYIASDNLDIRFRAKVDFSRASLVQTIVIDGSSPDPAANLGMLRTHIGNLSGRVDVEFVGRLGQAGNGAVSVPVVHIPVSATIPIPIEGIPFVEQAAADFLIKVFLSGLHATQHLSGHFQFGGGGGLEATAQRTHADGNLSGTQPELDTETAESPGTSGAVLAVQLPRIGLGIGLLGASTMVYVDQISVLTVTNSAGVATLNPSCSRITWDSTFHVGIETVVMPIPIPLVQTVASRALSQAQEVGHLQPVNHTTPDIAMCRVGSDK